MAHPIKDLIDAFGRDTVKQLARIPKDIGVLAADEFDRNFERQAFFNEPWPVSKRVEESGGSSLQLTGDLRRSIDFSVRGNAITFSTDRPDAQAHNEGAKTRAHEIRARHGRALKFAGKGGGDVYRRKVNHPGSNIPKQQFIGEHPMLEKEIEKYLDKKMKKIFDK